jgi:hypothetical protein
MRIFQTTRSERLALGFVLSLLAFAAATLLAWRAL